MALNITRKRKAVSRDEPPKKISKLEIAAETEADRYDIYTRLDCYECRIEGVEKTEGKLAQVIAGIMKATTFARQEEVKAWEQEMTACEHTLYLEQAPRKDIASQSLGQCSMCDLKENLWLCLACGSLGCGRAQFGGVGGNSHALAHGTQAHHPVAVKLGSLTADGTADVYCYECNEERVDPELTDHLGHWGIDVAGRQKTEKSLVELQIEQNLRWEFSMTTQDGEEMKPLFGPGLTGLKNLGNSCYLNSIIQCIFEMAQFRHRYYLPDIPAPASSQPAADLETQLRKLADGLLSGRYSRPDPDIIQADDARDLPHQKGLAPAMLKHLIGRGHSEFSTMRQQDASELFIHLMGLIEKSQHPPNMENPVNGFKFAMEQRLQCLRCKKVRYRTDEMDNISVPVPANMIEDAVNTIEGDALKKREYKSVTFKECLDRFTEPEVVELTCTACDGKGFTKQSLFKTFPAVMAITCRRYATINWVPTKVDVPVIVGDQPIVFDAYKSSGLQMDEELLPEDVENSAKASFEPNVAALAQLEGMGFPKIRCEKALKATGNADAELAMNWLLEHMDDADIDTPLASQVGVKGNAIADPAAIEQLTAMGFSQPQARQALRETSGNVEGAVEWLFANPDAQGDFEQEYSASTSRSPETTALPGSDQLSAIFELQSIVCHKGSSIHAGYVTFHLI